MRKITEQKQVTLTCETRQSGEQDEEDNRAKAGHMTCETRPSGKETNEDSQTTKVTSTCETRQSRVVDKMRKVTERERKSPEQMLT